MCAGGAAAGFAPDLGGMANLQGVVEQVAGRMERWEVARRWAVARAPVKRLVAKEVPPVWPLVAAVARVRRAALMEWAVVEQLVELRDRNGP